jgi:hypothetical protein
MSLNRHLSWTLSRGSEKLLPSLVKASGIKAVMVIAQALNREIAAEQSEAAKSRKRSWVYDGSTFWLTSLTTRDASETELKSVLGWQLVEAIRLLLGSDRRKVRAVVQLLNKFMPMVFRRVQLHVLATNIEGNVALANTWLRKRDVMRLTELNVEYFALLTAAAGHLDDTQRESLSTLLESTSRTLFREGPDQQKWAAQWLRDRLVALEPFLSGSWKEKFEAIVAEQGKAEPVDPGHGPVSIWVGPTSPISEQELGELTVENLVEYLRTFAPKKAFEPGPSIEGLGRSLSTVVAAAPERYALRAELFREVDGTYVRALLDGLRNARRANRSFDWGQALSLASWVVNQPSEASDAADTLDYGAADPGWRWVRKSLADLLASGFHGVGSFGFAERERIWTIIESLSSDPNPTTEYEAKYGGANMDPYTLAINTVRPQALDAAVQYAFWVRRSIIGEVTGDDRPERGFAFAPEAAKLIEHHLEPEHDRSHAVRAVIGHWLASLVWFDSAWVMKNWNLLFPERPDLASLAQATWGAHVRYGRLFASTFELAPMYRFALLHPAGGDKLDDRSPDNRLAEHILTFYWWGLIDLDASDSLVALLFRSGTPAQKQHAIQYVGWSLGRTDGAIPLDVLHRLQALWDWRFPTLSTDANSSNAAAAEAAMEELEQFGHWFASRKFDIEWVLPRFDAVIQITGGTERAHSALEVLAEVADSMPLAAVTTLEKFSLAAGKEPWRFQLWKESAKQIMQAALYSAEPGAKEKATRLINKWTANVSPEYKQLLDNRSPDKTRSQ